MKFYLMTKVLAVEAPTEWTDSYSSKMAAKIEEELRASINALQTRLREKCSKELTLIVHD